ncbi:similar to Saccharomyces cerevisiae YGL028C SCW11 Cell wall protein with similarity to glucanases [Maudiozyma saulgeensis]|uniref:Similar to Saccharomyces cerevisiae YGL028C SCW11 Cell wall protein with similarity to glucanases n=1 Tax=Maudiozyma saulgeensis TaxID=1789683 RepID=A0A1X7RAL5_9SACH|nr:similar to Saccharomyces cerevisiae YGL028C SCW11 Cell wall protein with similarity to glucanases [Kazachstania saulgeensis]
MLSSYTSLTYILLFTSVVSALPVFQNKKIVTRVHTASTTNTVTDFYSTTTEVIVAPTVEYIVSDTVTFTTTLYPEGVDTTVEPSTTITVMQNNVNPTFITAPSSSSSVIETPAVTSSTTTTLEPATSTTTTLEPATPSTTTLEPTTTSSVYVPETTTSSSTYTAPTKVVPVTVSTQGKTTTTMVPVLTDVVNNEHIEGSTPATTNQVAATTTTTAAVDQSTEVSTTSSIASATSTYNSNSLLSKIPVTLVYSPYNDDGSCKSATDVYNDLSIIKARGVNKIRIYGTDCNSFETVLPVCAQFGMTVNQGLWIGSAGVDSINDAITQLITYGQSNGWGVFDYITVGNEAVISGYCTVADLISKIASVKSQLQAAGYSGQITTSEPPVTYENNPELCTDSAIDFVGINPHSYFDTYSTAETSGSFVLGQLQLIQKTCGTSNVVVTETGYPSAGIQNGGNIPSQANQLIAVQSILDTVGTDVTILTYTNDYWKNAGPYGIEQSFGIIDILP